MFRPRCTRDEYGHTTLDGYTRWGKFHVRPRYRCHPLDGSKSHTFTVPLGPRTPTEFHPHSGGACPMCEHVLGRHEGPKVGVDFTFTIAEIAATLVAVGRGDSLRGSGKQTRALAHRARPSPQAKKAQTRRAKRIAAGKPVRKIKPQNRFRRPDETSNEGRLASSYVDAFTTLILDELAPREWPAVISIDSLPLRSKAIDPATGRKNKRGGEEIGEIMVAIDETSSPPRPILVRVLGGKDNKSWAEFMGSLSGAPAYVVADRGPEIDRAVGDVWSDAVLYSCEGHLLRNAQEYATLDGIPEWVPAAGIEVAAVPNLRWQRPTNQAQFELSPVWKALNSAQHSPEKWRALRDAITTYEEQRNLDAEILDMPPYRAAMLSKWLDDNEGLVFAQWQFRYADKAHRALPRGTAAAESAIKAIGTAMVGRAGRFRNRRRLDMILSLICLRLRGDANAVAYQGLIRRYFEEHQGHGAVTWRTGLDEKGTSSLYAMIYASDVRAAASRVATEDARRAAAAVATLEAREAERAAGGLPDEQRGRKRRATPPIYRSLRGKYVTDFEDLESTWHWARNDDLDPSKIRASKPDSVWWICRAHPGHLHEWERPIVGRAGGADGCPFCANRRACPANSVEDIFPDLAKEWSPQNGELTPDQVVVAANIEVMWTCLAGKGHPDNKQRVASRTRAAAGCPPCGRERAVVKARKKAAESQARSRQLARLVPRPAKPKGKSVSQRTIPGALSEDGEVLIREATILELDDPNDDEPF